MPLLDFYEIPPSKAPSSDVSAFEKFAKDFFVTIYGADIEKTVGRGADGGADIVIRVGDERWLISCKHYLVGSVRRDDEGSPLGDMQQWGCQQFVGFYSPEPSAGLEAKLRQTASSNTSFRYQIFDNRDIERTLMQSGPAAGWPLASRWFPKSFSKIASSLVSPLSEYSNNDVINTDGTARIKGISTFISYSKKNLTAAELASKDLVSLANEIATDKVFAMIFIERIKEFCIAVPGTFHRPSFVLDANVSSAVIFPSWNLELIKKICSDGNKVGLKSICRIWSLWHLESAEAVYYYGRNIIESKADSLISVDITDIRHLREVVKKHEENSDYNHKGKQYRSALTFASIASEGHTTQRGYFASLLCYCPSNLTPFLSIEYAIVELAARFDEKDSLAVALTNIMSNFDDFDLDYIREYSQTLLSHLISIAYLDPDYREKLLVINPNLRCITAPMLDLWSPDGEENTTISNSLGFGKNQ
ncbi:restriction endonuclease [Pseudomonas sp. NPDC088368]|uniref:restriction endonuclease n=1 Tax=Pseudomonas sp. NPDC088368 TaxID=3364453 RepID=UPI0038180A1C